MGVYDPLTKFYIHMIGSQYHVIPTHDYIWNWDHEDQWLPAWVQVMPEPADQAMIWTH